MSADYNAAQLTPAQRESAVEDWLLKAAPDRRQALTEWAEDGITALECGREFSAVRIPAELIYAAAQGREPEAVDDYLHQALQGGPIFAGRYWHQYYALVRPGVAARWEHRGVSLLDRDVQLGVPHPALIRCTPGHPYWCVPLTGPGSVCETQTVAQLLDVGRLRLAGEGAAR